MAALKWTRQRHLQEDANATLQGTVVGVNAWVSHYDAEIFRLRLLHSKRVN